MTTQIENMPEGIKDWLGRPMPEPEFGEPLMEQFKVEGTRLPDNLKTYMRPYYDLARLVCGTCIPSDKRTEALNTLKDARDAHFRALLHKD